MQLVFVVESDPGVRCNLERQLLEGGYSVEAFSIPTDVIRQAESRYPALIVIDSMLRSASGLQLCRRIRRNTLLHAIPVILLTYQSGENDRIAGLEAGADDCITKPFANAEFMARIQAVLRRCAPSPRHSDSSKNGVIHLGEIEIDSLGMRLTVAGRDIGATTLEFRLIQHLARNQGRVFTRDELLDAVWGNTEFVTPRSVDTCVRRIRKKMELSSSGSQLRTIRGVGYRLDGQGDETRSEAWD